MSPGESVLPNKNLDITPADEEGAHYYVYSTKFEKGKYTKARATVTLPTEKDMDWGPKGRERIAYISLGFMSAINGNSVDLGLRNFHGEGWYLYYPSVPRPYHFCLATWA